jgi:LysR family transcriptional regulator, nitrogen assimilation regulatory protein
MEDRLTKFAGVVEAGSFTKAAAALHISQPALTAAIKKLERELGAELLVRSHAKLSLTAAGTVAYEAARRLHVETQNLQARIREIAGQGSVLRLGLIDSLAHLLFVQGNYLQQLEQDTHVSLAIDNSMRLVDGVLHNRLDIAFIAQPERLAAVLTARTIGQEPLVLVSRSDLSAATNQDINHRYLRHFISYNQASRTHHLITEHFAQRGISLQPTFWSTSPEIMLQLVLSGRGSAVLPYTLVAAGIAAGLLQAIPIGDNPVINRTIISLQRTGRFTSLQAGNVMAHTSSQLKALNTAAKGL